MFKHVLVGVDGQEGGRDAVALAKRLRAVDGELTLAHVCRDDPHAWRGTRPSYQAEQEERASHLLAQAREDGGAPALLRSYRALTVGRGLHELAVETGADLLVIGSSRRGPLGRLLLGDDTRAALNGAPCAVAIATDGYAHHPNVLHKIGVGYDGSAESEHALGFARMLADALNLKLSAFATGSFPSRAFTGLPVPEEPMFGEVALYSASLDLLVIGSRNCGPLGRLMHGSTARQLARKAPCPLLVLTRASRESRAAAV